VIALWDRPPASSLQPAAVSMKAIRLGRPWIFSWPGVSIKPFPSGSPLERLDVGTNKKRFGVDAEFAAKFDGCASLIGRPLTPGVCVNWKMFRTPAHQEED